MPQKTKNMFSRRKTAELICDMKMMPGRFTYELVSEMGKPGNAEAKIAVWRHCSENTKATVTFIIHEDENYSCFL